MATRPKRLAQLCERSEHNLTQEHRLGERRIAGRAKNRRCMGKDRVQPRQAVGGTQGAESVLSRQRRQALIPRPKRPAHYASKASIIDAKASLGRKKNQTRSKNRRRKGKNKRPTALSGWRPVQSRPRIVRAKRA